MCTGYNGDYAGQTATLQARRDSYGNLRPDGKNWTWPENIHPARFYLGIKGLKEDGTKAKDSDFLARNGLKYGQIYGYTIDMTENGPTGGKWRDEAHKGAPNGFKVPGFWKAQPWRWDGTVRDFQHDGSWDFQVGFDDDPEWKGYAWWNANGYDAPGAKCEHLSPVSFNLVLECCFSFFSLNPCDCVCDIGYSSRQDRLHSRLDGRLFWPLLRQ